MASTIAAAGLTSAPSIEGLTDAFTVFTIVAAAAALEVTLLDDVDAAPVDARMKPVLGYVRRLTQTPSRITAADAEAVFAAGWDERALHDAGYFGVAAQLLATQGYASLLAPPPCKVGSRAAATTASAPAKADPRLPIPRLASSAWSGRAGPSEDSQIRSIATMRSWLILLVLLALAVSACGTARNEAAQAGAAVPTTTAAPATQPSTASTQPARQVPRGIVPAARRQPARALRVTAFDGDTVTLEQFRGRPLVVNFFESWCPICQAEQPDLSKVAKQFAGRVGFVGVSNHDTVAAGRAYQLRFEVGYRLANDASGRTWARWGVAYQPVTVVVDKQGRIVERFDGGITAGTLREALVWLLGE